MGTPDIANRAQQFIIVFIERRIPTHVATNGAAIIHNLELALVGGTSEDVTK